MMILGIVYHCFTNITITVVPMHANTHRDLLIQTSVLVAGENPVWKQEVWPLTWVSLKTWDESPNDSGRCAFSRCFNRSQKNEKDSDIYEIRGIASDISKNRKHESKQS